jgi:predicted nucleotidyltransferase
MMITNNKVIKVLHNLKYQIKTQYGIEHLWLFGSVARDEATPHSDVDLLYMPSKPLGLELMTLWDELETQLGCKVDLGDIRYLKPTLKALIAKDCLKVF